MFPCFEIPRPLATIRFQMKRPNGDIAARGDMAHRDHKRPILAVTGDENQQVGLVVVTHVTLVTTATFLSG